MKRRAFATAVLSARLRAGACVVLLGRCWPAALFSTEHCQEASAHPFNFGRLLRSQAARPGCDSGAFAIN